ncbi:NAD(P)-dependent oxidoreductase [uncultured Acidaminococcus sp.]|uniref:NAD(P)-dependent oxidoreductase n=1 Tax=uncultured Acidaminococcus sp. TaxID=352152 RepID=UPI00294350CC|nr:NAD(P)-dependent oxidoreductase [uncultured Acidaminococcus sp.]
MSIHELEEANRCLQCKKPMCREGCPIHTNIPEMIRLFKENDLMTAAQMLFDNNPLSVVCSLVCNHAAQCEGHCIRGIKGAPVHISAIENYISDSCFDRLKIDQAPSNGKKVAIIGAGPAGITIAIILAKRGYQITVFDSRDKIGGIMWYGIPEFRLPWYILDRFEDRMKKMGIKFRFNFTIGGNITLKDLFADGYKSVFIGTGAWRPKRMLIPGETFGNVHYAISYLNNPDAVDLGQSVAIFGSGNSAMDVARTAVRHGCKSVTVYVRRDHVSASQDEYEYSLLDGVKYEFNKTAVAIRDEGPMVADTKVEDGHVTVLEDTARLVPVDSVVIAVSQVPKRRLVEHNEGLELNDRGNLKTSEDGETTLPGVFASGDVVTGAKTVVHAVEYSKKIADEMDLYMKNLDKKG